LVDPRTKKRHESADNEISSQSSNTNTRQEGQEVYEDMDTDESSHSTSIGVLMQDIERSVDTEENQDIMEDDSYIDVDFDFLPRERTSRYTKYSIEPIEPSESEQSTDISANYEPNEIFEDYFEPSESEQRQSTDNEPNEIFEDYSCPPLESFYDANVTHTIHNDRFLWILLWIMNFRKRFNIPETATESLIKFMKLVLNEIGGDDFSTFPDSLYMARNKLGLKDQFQALVPCPKCHKLYEKDEVENFRQGVTPAIMKCRHVEFPNSSTRWLNLCQEPLSRLTKSLDASIIIRPELIYPFAGINNQLATMLRRSGFESSLRHWATRSKMDNILTDIYDGEVWRTFKDDDSTVFF